MQLGSSHTYQQQNSFGSESTVTPEYASYYGRGKLLLTGEYLVLDGALALALPTRFGQSLKVNYKPSFSPKLHWRSYDFDGSCWFDEKFEFWHFSPLSEKPRIEALELQRILQQVRKQNPHFLRDDMDVIVETNLEFPLKWGLGSSSTLIYNIAQWAYIGPFELLFKTMGGSGYDIACAQSGTPILYDKKYDVPRWEVAEFDPAFKDNLYFVYLGKKQSSRDGVKYYRDRVKDYHGLVDQLSDLTRAFVSASNLNECQRVIQEHERLLSAALKVPRMMDLYFSDYWGEIKSLGAWGGDFILVTNDREYSEMEEYFVSRGLEVIIPYSDMIACQDLGILNSNETIYLQ